MDASDASPERHDPGQHYPDGPASAEPSNPVREAQARLEAAARAGEEGDGEEVRAQVRAALAASDLSFVRVLEDLISVLLEKNMLLLTDLPEAAQDKILQRQEIRSSIGDLGNLVADEDDEFDGYI